ACTGLPVSATAACTTTITTSPCIVITKSCDPTVPIGQPINYQVTVSNCSLNTPLTGVTVVDGIDGTIIGPINLAPGASQTFNGTHTAVQVPNNGCGPLTDTATATGVDSCTGQAVSATGTCTTTVVDTPPPVMTCPADIIVTGASCSATVTY